MKLKTSLWAAALAGAALAGIASGTHREYCGDGIEGNGAPADPDPAFQRAVHTFEAGGSSPTGGYAWRFAYSPDDAVHCTPSEQAGPSDPWRAPGDGEWESGFGGAALSIDNACDGWGSTHAGGGNYAGHHSVGPVYALNDVPLDLAWMTIIETPIDPAADPCRGDGIQDENDCYGSLGRSTWANGVATIAPSGTPARATPGTCGSVDGFLWVVLLAGPLPDDERCCGHLTTQPLEYVAPAASGDDDTAVACLKDDGAPTYLVARGDPASPTDPDGAEWHSNCVAYVEPDGLVSVPVRGSVWQ